MDRLLTVLCIVLGMGYSSEHNKVSVLGIKMIVNSHSDKNTQGKRLEEILEQKLSLKLLFFQ